MLILIERFFINIYSTYFSIKKAIILTILNRKYRKIRGILNLTSNYFIGLNAFKLIVLINLKSYVIFLTLENHGIKIYEISIKSV